MSKKRSRRTRRPTADRTATTDIVTQLEIAIRNPHAAAIGALIGGLVPWFGRTLAHGEIQGAWSSNRALAIAMVAVVMGCGVFSGLSVYKFGLAAFGDARKALGFVLALEGVMLVSHGVTSAVALAVLILINAVANGSVIALARDAACRRRDADARRVASRRKTAPAPAARSTQPLQAPGVFEAPSPRTNDTSLVRWIPTSRHLDVPSCDVRRPRGTADHAKTHVARPGERDKTMKEML
jgi:hypothetical protein